ncbi:chorismate mutase [Selenomonas sp. TAMA-11512]|uniref:chorismate mutase n=1 Tax=Selenomonas sp. TAMA-11512 TaxID=3095337 RepID=UPI00308D88B9|nr:chorismate mutase [Selenomonas sp. TAMA-11512]
MQGIRGAITVEEDTKEMIFQSVRLLVTDICRMNRISSEDIGAAIFTATKDLTAAFPAAGARELKGFDTVPLFDAQQMDVTDSLERCIRVLLLVNTDKKQNEIHHIYLGEARGLRPDLR